MLIHAPQGATRAANRLPLDEALRLPAKLRLKLVAWYRNEGAHAEATTLLDAIEAQSGRIQATRDERVLLAIANGDHAKAESLLRERSHHSPSATASVSLARLLLETGRAAEAAKISRDLLQRDSNLATVVQLAAEVALANEDLATANSHYRALLADRPGNVTAILGLAAIAVSRGNLPDATAMVQVILANETNVFPLSVKQLGAIATILEESGDSDRAAPLREQAEDLKRTRSQELWGEIASIVETRISTPAFVSPLHPTPVTRGNPEPASIPAAPSSPPVAVPTLDPVELSPVVMHQLTTLFGHESLRSGQAAVITHVLTGQDTLATMPTGAGKSLTFQLPAMLLDGVTLVLSPLIALMKDQVDTLPPPVRAQTILVNSTLSPEEVRGALRGIEAGQYRLVYAAPERLRQAAFVQALRKAGTGLVVIDEAHCISMWGHDFRPDYLTIPGTLHQLGNPAVLAITATATDRTAASIAEALGRDLTRVRVSLFRPNLFYDVHRLTNREHKIAKAIEICRTVRGQGIIYVSSRKDAEAIASLLSARTNGVNAVPYHAGLPSDVRSRNQDAFMS
nr:RecQ family ATP-dependent DNA helicase [Chloroflexota bacterium]